MYKRILTIQDISCVGQCSLTVALPILSACGLETCILPSAVLSTHTCGFQGFTFRDLTEDIPGIAAHWKKEGIRFDSVYTGYLGSRKQISYVSEILADVRSGGGKIFVDPAMADGGKYYPLFDDAYGSDMKKLCDGADFILPNITEACLLTGTEYCENYDRSYIEGLLDALSSGGTSVILTGVGYREGFTGVAVREGGVTSYYEHKKISQGCHGTGDVYASAFVGAYMQEKSAFEAAVIAANYTVKCIENTQGDPTHSYGVKFETVLPELMSELSE